MWTHPGIDVFDELDSRAGLQPAHLIKWNPFLDEAAAVLELESCEDLVIGVLDHFLENEPSPSLHPSTSLAVGRGSRCAQDRGLGLRNGVRCRSTGGFKGPHDRTIWLKRWISKSRPSHHRPSHRQRSRR